MIDPDALDPAMRRDRDGSWVLAEQDRPLAAAAHRCERGWLGEDLDGRLVPCIICRPHLARAAIDRKRLAG